MSLKAWYPFINNTDNQGLGDLNLTNTTTPSFGGNGKIGTTCLTSGGFKWSAAQTASVFNNNELTIAFWIKVTGTSGGILFGNDGMSANNNRKFTLYQYPTANDLHWSWMNDTASTTFLGEVISGVFPTNTWTHCCITYKNPELKVYINGSLIVTRTGVSNSSSFAYETQVLHNNSNRCIQDLRFYDNALSTKEVKLLSQGLVAHYQLKGMGSTNYLKGAGKYTKDNPFIRNASDLSYQMNDSYLYHGDVLTVTAPIDGIYTFVLECDGNPSAHQTSGTVGSERRIGFWLRAHSDGNHYFWSNYGISSTGQMYGQFNIPADTYDFRTNLYADDDVNYTVKFWNMKISAGGYNPNDTWCPNSEDELYNNLNLGSIVGTDCSGYGKHASIIGSITANADTRRYGNSSYFNSGAYLRLPTMSFAGMANSYTFSYWAKIADMNGKMVWGFMDGNRLNVYPSSWFNWNTGDSADNPFRSGSTNVVFTPYNGSWHHYAITGNGSTTTLYIDGKSVGTAKTYKSLTGTQLIISGWDTSGSYKWNDGSIVDYRIYATCLSSADIAELYNTSASLTKDGKLMAYDFHENKRNSIDKDGIFASGGFSNKTVPTYDMKIKALGDGSTWARIHYLDITNDKTFFANASEVAKCTNKNNRYSRMGIVDKYKAGSEFEFILTYPSIKKTVPTGYTELEYIEATGTQWINTGITENARWEFDIQFTPNANRQLMGYSGNGWMYWGTRTETSYEIEGNIISGVTVGKRHTIVHDFVAKTLRIQDVTVSINTSNAANGTYSLLSLGSSGYYCKAKLYRCKCIQGTSLVRDFIPVQRNSDGAIGLIDVVNNTFYGNSGSGVFIAGPKAKESFPMYNRWIQNSWITDVNQGDNISFKPIFSSWPQHLGPIKPAQSTADTLYDCDNIGTGNWYAPIGQYKIWEGGIPAADGTPQSQTELWVRTDRFTNTNKLQIYNGFITATDYIEI